MKFDGGDLPAWVAGQKLNLRRQTRWQLNTLMLEKCIQLAFQAALVNPLSRPERSKAGADNNDDRDGPVITRLQNGK